MKKVEQIFFARLFGDGVEADWRQGVVWSTIRLSLRWRNRVIIAVWKLRLVARECKIASLSLRCSGQAWFKTKTNLWFD